MILLTVMFLFYPYKDGHDLQSHYGRLLAAYNSFVDGVFPVYFDHSLVNGYGFATRYFYCDISLIPFTFLIPYVGVVNTYNIMMTTYTLLCIALTYISTYKVFKIRYIAFMVTILYVFSYYRLYDVYNRAAVGESVCLTFFPLIFWGMYEIIKGNYKKWYILTIGFTLMIFAHVNTPAIVAFTLMIICIFYYKSFWKEPKRIKYLLLAAIVTIATTAYFIFPLFEQLQSNEFYLNTENGRRLTSNVLFGEPVKYILRGIFSGATYVVPEIAGTGIVLTFALVFSLTARKSKYTQLVNKLLIISLICFFIVSPFYPWRIFPFSLISFIQFSWRFYSVLTIILAITGAICIYYTFKNTKLGLLNSSLLFTILTIIVLINSGQVYTNYRDKAQVLEANVLNDYWMYGGDYLPSLVPNTNTFFENRANDSVRVVEKNATISDFSRKNRKVSMTVNIVGKDSLELPLIYYKGYTATFNDRLIKVEQSKNGLVQIPINKSGKIEVWFGGTAIQKYSIYISMISILLMIVYIIMQNRKKNA